MRRRIGEQPLFLETLGNDIIACRSFLGLRLLGDRDGRQQQRSHRTTEQPRGQPRASSSASHLHTPNAPVSLWHDAKIPTWWKRIIQN